MDIASKNQNYEKAAILRDRIKSLTFIQSSQHISKKNFNNADLIVSYRKEGNTCISVSFLDPNKIGVVSFFIRLTKKRITKLRLKFFHNTVL